jgi:TolC family type I secretion outer membrane protein
VSSSIRAYLTVISALTLAVFLSGSAYAEEPNAEPQATEAPAPAAQAPEPQTPEPQAFVSQASPVQNGQPASKVLTLEDAISLALGEHPKIKASAEDVRAGEFRTLEAQSPFWPQIFFQADRNYVWSQRIVRIGTTTVTTSADYVSNNFTFNGNWTLFDFGRTYYNVKSSRSLESTLRNDLNTAQQTVAYDVMDAYYNMLKFQSLVKVAEESLEASNSHLKQAQAFFEVGVKPRFDVTKAEVEVNNAKVKVIQATDAVKAARVNLNTRIGIDPLTPTEVEDRPDLEPVEMPMEDYLQAALTNRPEIKSLEDRLRSNEMTVRSEFAGYLPSISTGGSYNWNKEDHADFLNNSNVQIAANVPIFEGFRTTARVGQARAAVLASKYRVEDAKNDILNQVGVSYIAIEDARASIDALKVSVRSARENLDIAQGRYEAGVGAIIDVTDAQVSLTSAETDLAQAFYNYHLAYSKLLRSTGTPPGNQK